MDPRTSVIEDRLHGVKRIISVSGGKGGVGKSVVSSLLSLSLSKKGKKVGLLDLDLSSPSDHIILGVNGVYPEEKDGLLPPSFHGIKFMSITFFSGDKPSPLRGNEISDAIKEIMCITIWEKLDFLIIDTPPGIGDELFDLIELVKRSEFLLVTVPSKVSFETVRKIHAILRELRSPVIGVIENMKRESDDDFISKECNDEGITYMGSLRFDYNFERAIGDVNKLTLTEVFEDISDILESHILS